jgi:hypothetical protein
MKKIAVIGISILSVFILCSLSYQPIIADTPIEEIKETKVYDDCGCEDTNNWDFPIICWILERLWFFIPQISPFPVPLMHWVIIVINRIFDCPNIP